MTKKKVSVDDLEEGKTYQVLTKPMTLTEIDRSIILGIKIYTFTEDEDNPSDSIKLIPSEIDTIWEIE